MEQHSSNLQLTPRPIYVRPESEMTTRSQPPNQETTMDYTIPAAAGNGSFAKNRFSSQDVASTGPDSTSSLEMTNL